MTYQLYIGDRTFSSWSLRGWLMLEKFDLPFQTNLVGLYSGTMAADLAHLAPAKTVPVVQTAEGHILTDSLAMAETLAERHPEIDLYPRDPAARAFARSISAEMHSGFGALRGDCPMMVRFGWKGFAPSQAVRDDLQRIETLWALARERHGADGPWLFGAYSLADVFFAPVAMRITAYDLPVCKVAKDYVARHLADPAILAWRKAASEEVHDPWPYPIELPRTAWPGDEN
jgi:glutathione S-transferase